MSACRFCGRKLSSTFIDLGMSPLSNAFLRSTQLDQRESFYPLHAYVCAACKLVQLKKYESPQNIFSDYVYFSSYSKTWLEHSRTYAEQMIASFGLSTKSRVIEIASNDGYLLQFFKRKGIPVLGIEPAKNVAQAALKKGIPTQVRFFGVETAKWLRARGQQADLLLGNNVLAHVPDINDFVAGLNIALKPTGLITMEFPHLLQLMALNQFDTIYHEHFSYLSLFVVESIFRKHGLIIFRVDELPTHGGSLRIYAKRAGRKSLVLHPSVEKIRIMEKKAGLDRLATYASFEQKALSVKGALVDFLIRAKRRGKVVVGYGAPAKGNTLLNYCGIRRDLLAYTVDRSPHKQGLFLPGTHIPVYAPRKIAETKPDYVLILPWNIKDEIREQMSFIRRWGGRFVIPIPKVAVL
jgi:2-polyprenyl-3-methyl-5-hydroxy-6-metoxy-1,4-benzoquinol methylase